MAVYDDCPFCYICEDCGYLNDEGICDFDTDTLLIEPQGIYGILQADT